VSIKKLPDGRYEWRHRVGGRHLKRTFPIRKQAVDHDAKVKADLARGTHIDTTNRTTVTEYYRQWIDARVMRSSTLSHRLLMLRNHIEPTPLGSRPLVKVKPSEIQAWVRSRADVLGPYTLRIHVGVLRSVFATAVLDGLIARNPVQPTERLSLPKMDTQKITPLTIPQVQAWADHAAAEVRAMIITQAGLGLRISELRALRVQDVDFLRREVHIDEQVDGRGRRVPLKTANSRRVVPLPSVTGEALAAHIAQFPPGPTGLIFRAQAKALRSDGRRNAIQPTLACWNPHHLSDEYRQAARAAGLPDSVVSHWLRHHYASVLLDAGESVHAVAERLGDRPEMVLNVYGHLMPDREDTTRKAVDAAWKQARQDSAEGAR